MFGGLIYKCNDAMEEYRWGKWRWWSDDSNDNDDDDNGDDDDGKEVLSWKQNFGND